jgi:hypothetical protein
MRKRIFFKEQFISLSSNTRNPMMTVFGSVANSPCGAGVACHHIMIHKRPNHGQIRRLFL